MGDCDLWAQDCSAGEKCMPWASDGGPDWNATRCSTVAFVPGTIGDACTVEASVYSGVDDCDIGLMCWDVDPDTNIGHCVALCSGSPDDPSCGDPTTQCRGVDDGLIPLCVPMCQPLLQDCAQGWACYPVDDTFTCLPDASGTDGGYGDGCDSDRECDAGLFCGTPEQLPWCDDDDGCCTSYCDRDQPDPNADCLGVPMGEECVYWYGPGDAPPGYEELGACIVPP